MSDLRFLLCDPIESITVEIDVLNGIKVFTLLLFELLFVHARS